MLSRNPPFIVLRTKLNIETSLIFSILHLIYFKAQSFVKLCADTYFTGSNSN